MEFARPGLIPLVFKTKNQPGSGEKFMVIVLKCEDVLVFT